VRRLGRRDDGNPAALRTGGTAAQIIDEMVRQTPEQAYDADFFESFAKRAGWRLPT
jgi:hypothetical protein